MSKYEPKTRFAKALWYAYAEFGEHVTACDECLDGPICEQGKPFFNRIIKLLGNVTTKASVDRWKKKYDQS